MQVERAGASRLRRGLRTSVAALAGVGLVGASSLLFGASAQAQTPKKNYHSGKDTATFTVLGVLDSNCLVSVGGDKIYIKPGDSIDFKSSLAGVNVANLPGLDGAAVAGMNVTAVIDKGTSHQHSFSVVGGKTTNVAHLPSGSHTLNWTATGVRVVPALLGGTLTLPFSSSALKSGAKLSWSGHTYVTKSAPDCKLSVSTPNVDASVGPVHVHVPGVKITAPVDPNKIASKIPGASSSKKSKSASTSKPATKQTSAAAAAENAGLLPVPARVVPKGYGSDTGGGGGSGGLYGSGTMAGTGGWVPSQLKNSDGTTTTLGNASSVPTAADQRASSGDSAKQSAQLPVVLAIIAIIALALVASTYARLFLLRRST